MPTTRERQIKFMNTFGERAVEAAIRGFLTRNRMTVLDLMPDEMVAEITSEMVSDWRFTQRNNRRNRAIFATARPKAITASALDAAALALTLASTAPAARLHAAE